MTDEGAKILVSAIEKKVSFCYGIFLAIMAGLAAGLFGINIIAAWAAIIALSFLGMFLKVRISIENPFK